MKRFLTLLGTFIGIIIPAFIVYGEIFGTVHSAKKHSTKDMVASILIPPWSWYRSIEMWWHNDNAGVDWNKRLASDLRSAIYFITEGSDKDGNQYQINEDLPTFISKIATYPKDKKTYLMNGVRTFCDYSWSGANDSFQAMNSYFENGKMQFEYSSETKKLRSILVDEYKIPDLIEPLEKEIQMEIQQMNMDTTKKYSGTELNQIEQKFHSRVLTAMSIRKEKMNGIFKRLFNENL